MSEGPADSSCVFECTVCEGVLQVRRPDTEWLSTGWAGGRSHADAAYNVTVPEGFDRTDLDAYVETRRSEAGFGAVGPALLTGVAQRHARGARLGPVEAVATAGVSNPAALPSDPAGGESSVGTVIDDVPPGTVNVVLGTTRALSEGALASLLACTVEAKTATLLAETGFPGTTTDAVVVGCDLDGDRAHFAGSATEVGTAARACVREAVAASLASRYADESPPSSLDAAEYGGSTDVRAAVFRPE